MLKLNIKSDLLYYAVFLLLSLVFLLSFSSSTSPLAPIYPMDSTIFMVMGKMFADGKVPYLEFFDHKGPSLILIEAIGMMIIPNRNGVFLLQFIHMFLILATVWKMANLVLSKFQSVGIAVLVLIPIKYVFHSGNSSEEFSLLATFISFYYFSRIFFLKEKIQLKNIFIIGLCFSFVFWLRLNNALPIAAIILYLFLDQLTQKNYKTLQILVIGLLLGQLPFTTLYLGYFLYHDAVYEMIYATFLFNFLYVKEYFAFNPSHKFFHISQIIFFVIGSILYYRKKKDPKIFILVTILLIFSTLATNIGKSLDHYFINAISSIVWGMLLVLYGINKKWIVNSVTIILILLSVRMLIFGMSSALFMNEQMQEQLTIKKANREEVYNLIPIDERDRVYFHDHYPEVYPLLNINPNYKYFVLQEWHASFSPSIGTEIREMISGNTPPLWIVLFHPYYSRDRFENTNIIPLLEADYVTRFDNEVLVLLMLDRDKRTSYPPFKHYIKD